MQDIDKIKQLSNKQKIMEEKKVKEQKKLSYEELNQAASELWQANQKLTQQIQKMQKALENRDFDYSSFFLSMLFKVTEHIDLYSDEFKKWTIENIQAALTSFAASYSDLKESEPEKEQKDGSK